MLFHWIWKFGYLSNLIILTTLGPIFLVKWLDILDLLAKEFLLWPMLKLSQLNTGLFCSAFVQLSIGINVHLLKKTFFLPWLVYFHLYILKQNHLHQCDVLNKFLLWQTNPDSLSWVLYYSFFKRKKIIPYRNKLECFSISVTSTLDWSLRPRLGAYPLNGVPWEAPTRVSFSFTCKY